MKFHNTSSLLAAVFALFVFAAPFATSAQATTVFTPTSGNVNTFDFALFFGGSGAIFGVFDESFGGGFATPADYLAIDPADTIGFTPTVGGFDLTSSNAGDTFFLPGAISTFIIAVSIDSAFWSLDDGFAFDTDVAGNLIFGAAEATLRVTDVAVVPEPSTWLLLLGGLVMLLGLRIRKET